MPSHSTSADLVVIGAGPGGYAAAFLAADLGMQVALIDPEVNPGGVCLYRGCIPSKALLHVAKVVREAKEAGEFGVTFAAPKIAPAKLQSWKDSVVADMTAGLGQLVKHRKIEYIRGTASFTGPNTLDVRSGDGKASALAFKNAIIATGSHPAIIPAFDIGSERILDSTSALDLDHIPTSMLVIGGGYIGLELGSVYATLGSRVTVVEMLETLLPGADRDLAIALQKSISPIFEAVMLETTVEELKETKTGIRAHFTGKHAPDKDPVFERVLVSVGRRPNSSDLGLGSTRVVVNDAGFIEVDAQLRTAEPNIFAIGDVVGEPMLAHKASHEGRTAVEVVHGDDVAFEPRAIPAVVFTDPEVAWCGLTETEAKVQQREVAVARFPWAASGRAKTLGRSDGVTKLIIDPKTEQVLGAGIVGPGAGELIAEMVLAVEMAAVISDVKLSIHPHPTLSETVMEAAEVFFGQSTHVYRPQRKRA